MLQVIWISDLEHILYKYGKNGIGIGNSDRLYNCGFLVRRTIATTRFMSRGKNSIVDSLDTRIQDHTNILTNKLNNPYNISPIGYKLMEILKDKYEIPTIKTTRINI